MTKFKWKNRNERMNHPTKYVTFINHRNFKYIHENEYHKVSAFWKAATRDIRFKTGIFLQRVSPW